MLHADPGFPLTIGARVTVGHQAMLARLHDRRRLADRHPVGFVPPASPRSTRMADLFENPMGLMGFEFVEFASPKPRHARARVRDARLHLVARHRSKDVVLYRQGDINFIVNREPKSAAGYFAAEHGPSACGLAFRVKGFAQGLRARARARRAADGDADRPDGAAPAGDQGHRRRAAVPDRPLRGRQVDLRHRLRVHRRRRPPSRWATA